MIREVLNYDLPFTGLFFACLKADLLDFMGLVTLSQQSLRSCTPKVGDHKANSDVTFNGDC